MTPDELRALVEAATPGPWQLGLNFSLPAVYTADESMIAEMNVLDGSSAIDKKLVACAQENAALVALTPDLALQLADAMEEIDRAQADGVVTDEGLFIRPDASMARLWALLARFQELGGGSA